jgi:hypothetical protein
VGRFVIDRLTGFLSSLELSWLDALLVFGLAFVLTIALAVFILVSLPSTYFHLSHNRTFMQEHHPVVRWIGIALKNVAGLMLVLWGLAMLIPGVPGQGVLTVFVGLLLLDFPGKRAAERRLLRQPAVLRAVNKLRAKFSRPPLILD